ncbi:MAG: hypothetical protein NC037_04915 [Bacteroides sp.]|nr:hypothetical protein [Bacillota bacterium]MCM1394078.1 hypothetical protein [[Eubacterium] siraeum]MCM1455852.1 hypothetical protein [Bacteroides sp.]
MAGSKTKKTKKFALDSSATFYPYFTTAKTQSMFCVGATLNCEIDKDVLKRATNDAINRFPLYKTKIAKGYGAYYLKGIDKPVEVFGFDGKILKPIDTKLTNGYQFRLACDGDRIKLETFHALTDANGAVAFLAAIIRRYRELCGVRFDEDIKVFAWGDTPSDGEFEDAFKKYYKRISLGELNLKGMAGEAPHRIEGTLLDEYALIEGEADAEALVGCARAMGVSLTAYIAGVTAHSILKTSDVKRPIAIMIPVNLRKIFPSETLSNFITFVRLIIKKDECETLEDCVKSCAAQLADKASKEKMQAFISTTVRAQRNIIFRAAPLFLKWILMRLGRLFMKSRQTIIISNLGNFKFPAEMGIEEIYLNLNVSKNNVQNLGIASCGGKCKLMFTSAIEELDMPSAVLDTLRREVAKNNENASLSC